MSIDLSVDRHSTVAYFDLVIHDVSYKVAQLAPSFLILDRPQEPPLPGRGKLTIRSEGRPPVEREIEVLGVHAKLPDRLLIRR